jgi:hypothetical protein
MTDEDIVKLAKQAKIEVAFSLKDETELVVFRLGEAMAFARLIAAAQREEDAMLCESRQRTWSRCAVEIRNGGKS